jgi:hypothetical protein
MSRYSYHGSPHQATNQWRIAHDPARDERGEDAYFVEVDVACPCDCSHCTARVFQPHSNGMFFAEYEQADEWIESVQSFLDDDYDEYYEENRYHIVQMERYEIMRNEW